MDTIEYNVKEINRINNYHCYISDCDNKIQLCIKDCIVDEFADHIEIIINIYVDEDNEDVSRFKLGELYKLKVVCFSQNTLKEIVIIDDKLIFMHKKTTLKTNSKDYLCSQLYFYKSKR